METNTKGNEMSRTAERISDMSRAAAGRLRKSISLSTRTAAIGVALPGSARYAAHGLDSEPVVWLEWYRDETHDDDGMSDVSTVLRSGSGETVVTRYYAASDIDAITHQAREIGLDL